MADVGACRHEGQVAGRRRGRWRQGCREQELVNNHRHPIYALQGQAKYGK